MPTRGRVPGPADRYAVDPHPRAARRHRRCAMVGGVGAWRMARHRIADHNHQFPVDPHPILPPPAKLCPFARCAVERSRPWPLLQSGPIPSSLRAFRCAIFSLAALGRSTARNQSAPALAFAMG